MSQSLLVLGRQPGLGLAELESLYGGPYVRPVTRQTTILEVPSDTVEFSRLGGSVKLAKVLTIIPTTDWAAIEKYLTIELPKHTCCLPEGKIRLGLSVFDLTVNLRRLQATGLSLKKAVKADGRSVRLVPNKTHELNSAQVLHNQLTGPTGMELLLVRKSDTETILAQTVAVQDIEAYAARDQARPARDARVGMLPPKLAQIIINLAKPEPTDTVLDPFCGTGVVLQEALLIGRPAYGTDLEPRMIEYSEKNLTWLNQKHGDLPAYSLAIGDATSYAWNETFNRIACETYLGQPFSAEPNPSILKEVIHTVDIIHRKFLKNVAKQTEPGFRMCIAVPAWNTKAGFHHLKTLDNLEELGYNRLSFAHASNRDLIYYRENQVVGRELVTLIRK